MNVSRKSKGEALRIPLSGRIVKALADEDYTLASDLLQAAMLTLYRMPYHAQAAGAEKTYASLMTLTALAAQVLAVSQVTERSALLVEQLEQQAVKAETAKSHGEAGFIRTVKGLVGMDVRRSQSTVTANVRALVRGLGQPDVTAALNEAGR